MEINWVWAVLLAVAEAVIFLLVRKIPNFGEKYAPAFTGYAVFVITVSYLVSGRYVPPEVIFPVALIGIIAAILIVLAANIKIKRTSDIIKTLSDIGILLVVVNPVLLAIFTA